MMTNCEMVIVTTKLESGSTTEIQIPINSTLATHDEHDHLDLEQPLVSPEQSIVVGGPDKPFQCNVCERRFRQLSTLTNHVKIHTGEKPYKCTICEKSFRQSSTLTNHMKIHTGEKPFNCTFCDKQFRQLSTLTNHMKIHTGEKPFECAVCKKQFRQSSTLNNHIKIHVMDKLYIPFEIKTEEEEG